MKPRILTSLRARRLGTYKGAPVFEFPVLVHQSWLDRDLHEDEVIVRVTSTSAADAADLVRDEIGAKVSRPTEVTVVGPKGGVAAYRFIGWDSMVFQNFVQEKPTHVQLGLFGN